MIAQDRVAWFLLGLLIVGLITHWLAGVVGEWPRRRSRTERRSIGVSSDTSWPRDAGAPPPATGEQISDLTARSIAGMPLWQVRQFFNLTESSAATWSDLARWSDIHDRIERHLKAVETLIRHRAEELHREDERGRSAPGFIPMHIRADDDVA